MNSKVILLFICLGLANCSFFDKIGDKIDSTLSRWENGIQQAGEKVKDWGDHVEGKFDEAADKVKNWLDQFKHKKQNNQDNQTSIENMTEALPDEIRTTVRSIIKIIFEKNNV